MRAELSVLPSVSELQRFGGLGVCPVGFLRFFGVLVFETGSFEVVYIWDTTHRRLL